MAETLVTELSFLGKLYKTLATKFKIRWSTKDLKNKNIIHLDILSITREPVARFSEVKVTSKRKTKQVLAQKALDQLQGDST